MIYTTTEFVNSHIFHYLSLFIWFMRICPTVKRHVITFTCFVTGTYISYNVHVSPVSLQNILSITLMKLYTEDDTRHYSLQCRSLTRVTVTLPLKIMYTHTHIRTETTPGLSTGATAGISIAAILIAIVIFCCVVVCCCCYFYRHSRSKMTTSLMVQCESFCECINNP